MRIGLNLVIFFLFILIFCGLYFKYLQSQKELARNKRFENPSPSNSNPNRTLTGEKILILAPHQDDEALMCSGIIEAALIRGDSVKVGVITNGDRKGRRIGLTRIRETIKAMTYIGLTPPPAGYFFRVWRHQYGWQCFYEQAL